ncbi:MAG: hypoxanthine phosphoribosyltransferase [Oscillospiraceae bacterium]|nr:hypoxanthine phosphoribosyltransferase [Oscillospiraceae bacterium]
MHNDIESILFTKEDIEARIDELAAEINRDYKGMSPDVVGILRGSFIFMSDLVRKFDFPCRLDFMKISSYGSGTASSGNVKINQDIGMSIEGKDLLIIEDIVDSGNSMNSLFKLLATRNPRSVRLCTLLDKPDRRQVPVHIDYTGFSIPDAFVVGYGLDYADMYRSLPYIGILKPEIYSK